MASVKKRGEVLTVVADAGDAKTLLAFDLPKKNAKNLAGFTTKAACSNRS
jgi:hypothetical protein